MTPVKRLTIVDLFSGCGGLSTGFEKAGFTADLGIDICKYSIETYKQNHKSSKVICDDITKVTSKKILENVSKKPDIIIGGPPCQGFSLAGNRDVKDKRNQLLNQFIRIITTIKPKFFVLENVPGLISMKDVDGELFLNKIIKKFKAGGYDVKYKVMSSENYGVPQKRKRLVIVGNRVKVDFSFPEIKNDGVKKSFVTVGDAISDLPMLDKDFGSEEVEYKLKPKSKFQTLIRKGSKKIYNHIKSNHSENTIKVIGFVPEGGNWKDLPKRYQNIRSFSNTWKRLSSKEPSVTIDTGHRHHFHYKANRVPTVRESARIQSFPDSFIFSGPRTSQFRQVGNAVPPLMAECIAKEIKKFI